MEKDTINIRMTLSDKLGEMEHVLNDILCDMDYNFEAEEEYDDDVMVALGTVESAYHAVTLAKNSMQMAENFLSKSSTHYWDDADTIVSRLNYIKNNVDRWSCSCILADVIGPSFEIRGKLEELNEKKEKFDDFFRP